MEAVLFIGVQGAGKSTFYRERFFDTHLRLNLDMLRTRHRLRRLVEVSLETRQPFVLDNTHPTREERAPYIQMASSAGFTVVAYYFDVSLDDALRRNGERSERARVPAKGVIGTFKRIEPPSPDEGFGAIYRVKVRDGSFTVEEFARAV